MIALILLGLNLLAAFFKPKSRLEAENAALRQQLIVCSEPHKLDRFWLEFSAVIPRLGGAESDEGFEVFGRPEGVYTQTGY
ncbi:MAG: hypothetical protein WBF58_21965 [Xanthobacteraceae bacterium]